MIRPGRNVLILIGFALIAGLVVFLFRGEAERIIDLMGRYSGTPYSVAIALLVFFIGSIFLVPQWALIAAAIAAFGLVEGTAIAWLATMVSASIHVLSARRLESRIRGRLESRQLSRLKTLFARNSVWAGLIVRFVPTGPALFVNAAAGLFGANAGGFLLGTAIGIIPKILLTAVVVSELISTAQGQRISFWLAVAVVGMLGLYALSRAATRLSRTEETK